MLLHEGGGVMVIIKVLNNNSVISKTDNGREVILIGTGIGFHKQPGETVNEAVVRKIFKLDTAQQHDLSALLAEISADEVEIVRESVALIERLTDKSISQNIFLTLTDHLHLAIQRVHDGEVMPNPLQSQIKLFYPTEFGIAKQLVLNIRKKFDINLPDDEIGFITLHIVNSEDNQTTLQETVAVTNLVSDTTTVIDQFYDHEISKDDQNYQRLIVHLQFFARRFLQGQLGATMDDQLNEVIQSKFPIAYSCAQVIDAFLKNKKHKSIGKAEVAYLTMHIAKLTNENQ